MNTESRTQKSIMNAKVTLFFTIATFLLNFFSRKFFLDGLGAEIMGMRTLLGDILSMLSLSELGIGSAIAVALYKPLANKEYTTINEIISLQGWLYTRVFSFITLGVAILMFFMPELLSDMQAPMLYAYLTVGVFYTGTMLSYTVNYKSIVLSADQKNYKTSLILSSAGLIKSVVQLAILRYLETPYIYWLGMDLLMALLGVYVIDRVTKKEYPWLKINKSKGYEYYKKYPEILRHTGQLFIHSIASFALSKGTPFLLYSFIGLSTITYYENFKNLITNIRAGIYSVFANLSAGAASLIAEGDREKTYSFFWEIISLKYLVGGIAAFAFFTFSGPFVTLWLGAEYVLPLPVLLIMTLIAYTDYTRGSVDAYIVGHKLFSDIWAPATEGILNIVLAIFFAKYLDWGFAGVLLGTYCSLLLIVKLWKPYLLFTRGFERSPWLYWHGALKFPIFTALFAVGLTQLIDYLELDLSSSYLQLLMHASWLNTLLALALFIAFYITSSGFRRMISRIHLLAQSSLNKLPFMKKDK